MFRRNQQPKIDQTLLQNPALPATLPTWVKSDDVAFVERQIASLQSIPWGQQPEQDPALAYARYQRGFNITGEAGGNYAKMEAAIPEFLHCPPDLAFTGAAYIMLRLSYLSGSNYVPQGIVAALDLTAKALRANPQQAEAWLARTQILCYHINDTAPEFAAVSLERARQLLHNAARLANIESIYYKRLNKPNERIASLEAALAGTATDQLLAPERMAALDSLASAYDAIGQTDRAIQTYDNLNAEFPQSAWSWFNASLILDRVGRTKEALEKCTTALSIMRFSNATVAQSVYRLKLSLQTPELDAPGTPDEREWAITARIRYAIWLEKQGPAMFAVADEQYRLALQLDPARVTTYVDYADFQENKLQQFETAAALYRECIRLRPTLGGYRFHLAKVLAKMGPAYAAAAEQEFQTLLTKDPKYIDVRCEYARFLLNQGPSRRQDAEREVQTAIKVSPNNATANALLKEIGGARAQLLN